jgi:hypothetical protein
LEGRDGVGLSILGRRDTLLDMSKIVILIISLLLMVRCYFLLQHRHLTKQRPLLAFRGSRSVIAVIGKAVKRRRF